MAQQSLYGLLLLFYGSGFLTLCHFIWNRRSIQPLKIREPYLMLISAFGGLLLTIMISLREINVVHFPCQIYVWIICTFPCIFFIPYLLRAVRLIFIYHWNQEKSKEGGNYGWYYKRKVWTKRGTLISIFLISLFIHIFIAYIILLNINENNENAGCTLANEFVLFLLIAIAYIITFALLIFKLRNVYDNFWIKTELKLCIYIWIPCLAIFFACNLWGKLFWLNEWFATSTWIVIMLIGTMIVSLLIPLCKTYTKKGRDSFVNYKKLTEQPYQLIGEILADRTGTAEKYLMQYLSRCFEPDNLRFLQDVRTYQNKTSEGRANFIHTIKDRYIITGSTMELSIFSKNEATNKVRTIILENILKGNTSRTYSAAILNEARALCISDTNARWMPQFIKSDEYMSLLGEMTRQNSVVEALEDESLA